MYCEIIRVDFFLAISEAKDLPIFVIIFIRELKIGKTRAQQWFKNINPCLVAWDPQGERKTRIKDKGL